jgi:molybdopterin-guanine dinucleotide biosynthesis protein A
MRDPSLEASLLVLAGGRSSRMGQPKALLPVAAGTLLEWVVMRLAASFGEVLLSVGAADDQLSRALPQGLPGRLVFDLHLGRGPLAGIEAGLAATSFDAVFAVACDMPHVTPELAAALLRAAQGRDAAVPRVGGRPEPVCAVYRQSAAGAVSAALREGRLRAAEVLDELDVAYLDSVDPDLLRSLNTPDEYRRFVDAMR